MNNTGQMETGFAEVNGTRLYYEVAGEGHPLALSHSFVSNKSLWDDQFSAFAQHYKVIRYDLRGFGSSGLIQEPYSQREDLDALLKFLGIEKTFLLGISGSSVIALDFTLEHPDMVDALISVSCGLSGYQSPQEASGEWPAEWQDFYEARQQGDVPKMAEAMLRYWIDGSNPTGVALFPKELLPPRPLAERFLRIERWAEMPRGGHFAALEEPELLAEDIRAFFRPFRASILAHIEAEG